MTESAKSKGTVAIIGSGPAGLSAAYALRKGGYSVTIFEQKDHLTLDGHSYGSGDAKVDIPMRTFSGKYYANLFNMLEHLNTPTQVLHCLENSALRNVCTLLCYLWYTIAIFLFPPRIRGIPSDHTQTESLVQYASRIYLPDYFLKWYLLPLFSSVATCSHAHLLSFPAAYITDYRKGTLAAHHYTVIDMEKLQDRLAKGAALELDRSVLSVTSKDNKVAVDHRKCSNTQRNAPADKTDIFDHAILATGALAASQIHEASSKVTSQLSSCKVIITVRKASEEQERLQKDTRPTEILALRTRMDPEMGAVTDSTHLHSSGVAVKVAACPSEGTPEDANGQLHRLEIYRPLPTPESHNLLLDVFNRKSETLKNGDGNVYLAGGYASPGHPLLEACVRSGLEAAKGIDRTLPFDIIRKTPF